jgi:hypothetical protein
MYRLSVKDEIIQLLLNATAFGMRIEIYKPVAIQNILPELEEKEVDEPAVLPLSGVTNFSVEAVACRSGSISLPSIFSAEEVFCTTY